MKNILWILGMTLTFLSPLTTQWLQAANRIQNFEVVAVEISGTKFWLPSTLIVKKGDIIKIHAVSKIGGKNNIHGYAIDEFKVEQLIDDKGKDFEFVASKTGTFPIRCHLHPAHIGGQLLVTE